MSLDPLKELQDSLGHRFADASLLQQAVVHKSYLNEMKVAGLRDNERLEFLGDAVLDLIISEDLIDRYPSTPEGDLSKMKARVVSEPALAEIARRIGLGKYLRLGRGEEMTQGREKPSLLADALEAILAAVYLDGGLAQARSVIHRIYGSDMEAFLETEIMIDYKTRLQEFCQREYDTLPVYTVIDETGPDHQKTFEVQLSVGGDVLGKGKGRSKKEAEQQAAREALERLEGG